MIKERLAMILSFIMRNFEKVFSYISPEQWKLFDFCGKVVSQIKI